MKKYLYIYWFELKDNKIDIQAKLKQYILYKSIICLNNIIKYYIEIYLKIAKKIVKLFKI